MALTEEQKTEVLSRLGNGERPFRIISAMGITREEIKSFRNEDNTAFRAAKDSKTARLARLNVEKARVEANLARINTRIAEVEAE